MYVGKILVKGYRSLEDVSIRFQPGINVLVGKNNAGKTNIIRALDLVLGERWPTYVEVEERDFYCSSDGSSVDRFLIAVRLEGEGFNREFITNETRAQVFKLKNAPSWNDFDQLEREPEGGRWRSGEDLAALLRGAQELWLYFLAPKGSRRGDRTFAAYLKDKSGDWHQLRKFGSEFRDVLLTTARIPSFRDPDQQFRITQYSWYGKLIKSLYERQTGEQANRIRDAQQQLTETVGEIFRDATTELCQRLAHAIFHYGISFKPGAYTPDDAHKQITMFVDDGLDTPYYDKGSGIQSALVIALFAYYCEHFHKGSSLLLVEEPEIYLHPQARRAIEAQLAEFVREGVSNGRCNHQVIISTHATEFLRSVDLEGITCVRKRPRRTATEVRQIGPIDEGVKTRWQQAIHTKNAEMFFADYVVLVEGGEEYILPVLADRRFEENRWMDFHNVSVVRADGKKQFVAYSEILSALDIPHCILTDLDFLLHKGIEDFYPERGTRESGDKKIASRLLLDDGLTERVKTFRQTFRQKLSQAGKPQPKGSDVKEALSPDTRDWTTLYKLVDQAIGELTAGRTVSGERLEEIRRLWDQLRDRVEKPGGREAVEDAGLAGDLDSLLESLKEKGFFILRYGELEDYLTPEVQQLEGSKDRRAMRVAQELAECANDVRKWLKDPKEFFDLLSYVAKQLGVQKQKQDESAEGQSESQQPEIEEEIPF
jgi:putative ATP-dependent endonuclease of OLD family